MSEIPKNREILFNFKIESSNTEYTVTKLPLVNNYGIQFETFDERGNSIAWIQGKEAFEGERIIFQSSWIANPQRKKDKGHNSPAYVPYGVGRTVVELVSRGVMDVWRSSLVQSNDARKLYQRYFPTIPTILVSTQNNISFEITRR